MLARHVVYLAVRCQMQFEVQCPLSFHLTALLLQVRKYCLQSVACDRLGVPMVWLAQQQPFGLIVIDWLMGFWTDGSLASFLAHVHFAETQLAAGVALLKQLVNPAAGAGQPVHLPATPNQRQLSAFIVATLWSKLQHAIQLPQLSPDDAHRLCCSLQCIHKSDTTASAQRYLLLAAHDLLTDCTSNSLQQIQAGLKAIAQLGSLQLSAEATYARLFDVLAPLHMQRCASLAAETLVFDLIRRIAKTQELGQAMRTELLAALSCVFSSSIAQSKHMQEHILMELLSPETLQPINRAKVQAVEGVLHDYAVSLLTAPSYPVLHRVLGAELTYLSEFYGDMRYSHVNGVYVAVAAILLLCMSGLWQLPAMQSVLHS